MYPFYAGYIPDFTLPYDDIYGIQAIYGAAPQPTIQSTPEPTKPSTTTTTTTQRATDSPITTTQASVPNICEEGIMDAVTSTFIDGRSITHVFRGDYYIQVVKLLHFKVGFLKQNTMM